MVLLFRRCFELSRTKDRIAENDIAGSNHMINDQMTLEEILYAKEGEHFQFKEAKNRFDFGVALLCIPPL